MRTIHKFLVTCSNIVHRQRLKTLDAEIFTHKRTDDFVESEKENEGGFLGGVLALRGEVLDRNCALKDTDRGGSGAS